MAWPKNTVGRGVSSGDWGDVEIHGTITSYKGDVRLAGLDGFSIFERNGNGLGAPGILRIELEDVRICRECAIPKPIDAFPINSQSWRIPKNRMKVCKVCRSKIMTARYHRLAREGKLESRKSTRRGTGCTTRPMATGKHASQCYCDVCAVATDPKKRKPPNFRGFYDSEVKLLERIIT